MRLELYSRWLNEVTKERWMLIEKWCTGSDITSYELVNIETEEPKRINANYMHQIIGEGKLTRIKPNPAAADKITADN